MSNIPKGQHDGHLPHDTKKGHHHRKQKKHHPRRPCGVVPRNPDGVNITFEHYNKGKHRKIRAVVQWDEVTRDTGGHDIAPDAEGGHGTKIARYHIRLDRSDDGVDWTDPHVPQRTVKAKEDGDHNTTADVLFHNIERRYYYRAQVIAVDKNGCESHWSANGTDDTWTAPELPYDNDPPPRPNDVVIWQKRPGVIAIDWTAPTIDFPQHGLVTKASGDDMLSGVLSQFTVESPPGTKITVGAETKEVIAVVSDTSLQVASNWSTSAAGVHYTTPIEDPDIHHFEVQLSQGDTDYTPIYKRDQRVHGTKRIFQIPKEDHDNTHAARVRSWDAAENKSAWIEATVAGNSDPDVTGDLVVIRKDPIVIATWTFPGQADVGYYDQLWTADQDYDIVWARARAGRHRSGDHPDDGAPTGSGMRFMLHRIGGDGDFDADDDFFPNDTTLKIDSGDHRDGAGISTFEFDQILEDEMVAVEITQVGSSNPGSNVVIQLKLREA